MCTPMCNNCEFHGRCIAPGKCKCYDGYTKNATEHCVPTCFPECLGGQCVAPNQCQCPPQYAMANDGFTCEPICGPACVQGKCIEPNVCECFPGYQANNETSHECLPICDFCDGDDCPKEESDLCTCWDSYEVQDYVHGEKFKFSHLMVF